MATEVDYEVAQQLFPDLPSGFPYKNFDVEELILPDGDDMGINSDDEGAHEQVVMESGFGNVVAIIGLPMVNDEKFEKLMGVVKKVCNDATKLEGAAQGALLKQDGLHMPMDGNADGQKTRGICFVEFAKQTDAVRCVEALQEGLKLDKVHTLFACRFDDFDYFSRVPDEYEPRAPQEYKPIENLCSWMTDKLGRDQIVMRAGEEVEVLYNDGKRGRTESAYKRENWTESFVQWSPQGTMLATMHRQGVAVWGGPTFPRLNRYAHPNARLIDFSPNEKYLVSYTSSPDPRPGQQDAYVVMLHMFDVRSSKSLRTFQGPNHDWAVGASRGPGGALVWPVFKWAGGKEDQYFARLRIDQISIYDCATMALAAIPGEKDTIGPKGEVIKPKLRSMDIKHVHDFEWSPAEPIFAAYAKEDKDQPARVMLVKMPERTEIRQKGLSNVSELRLHWHPQGSYMAASVIRFTKTKKSTTSGFEIFSLRDKDIPMEVIELPNKNDKIFSFAWEPKGHRFAVVHGEEKSARPNITIFSMRDDKGRLTARVLNTLQSRPVTSIHWSPQGKYMVIAGLKNLNGQLEFFNVDDMETMATAEHFMATDVEWDPTGRYIATSITSVHQMENGINVWSFAGKLLMNQPRDRLVQFAWRPRVPSLLPAEKEAEILKNLKTFTKRYDEEDDQLLLQADADVLQDRQRLVDEWTAFAERKRGYRSIMEDFCKEVYGPRWAEREFTMSTASVEQILDVREEPYVAK